MQRRGGRLEGRSVRWRGEKRGWKDEEGDEGAEGKGGGWEA